VGLIGRRRDVVGRFVGGPVGLMVSPRRIAFASSHPIGGPTSWPAAVTIWNLVRWWGCSITVKGGGMVGRSFMVLRSWVS